VTIRFSLFNAEMVGRAIGGGPATEGEPCRRAADVVPVNEGPVKDQLVVAGLAAGGAVKERPFRN